MRAKVWFSDRFIEDYGWNDDNFLTRIPSYLHQIGFDPDVIVNLSKLTGFTDCPLVKDVTRVTYYIGIRDERD